MLEKPRIRNETDNTEKNGYKNIILKNWRKT